jgi:hypothetical protein
MTVRSHAGACVLFSRDASSGAIQRMAALGDLAGATARLEACGADREMIALAEECLTREPEDRLSRRGHRARTSRNRG